MIKVYYWDRMDELGWFWIERGWLDIAFFRILFDY